jgi:Iap family predicted aminopeptidase
MKWLRSLLIIVVMGICSLTHAQTAEELRSTVEYLASQELRGRATATKDIQKAQDWIVARCQEAGLQVQRQTVPTPRGKCQNVIAWIEGSDPTQVVVIGAHLDHIGVRNRRVYPGADDNASGSAAVLGLAKRFAAGTQPAFTIAFQWYTGEEINPYLVGSKYYVKNPTLPVGDPDIDQHIVMLNIDMIGHLKKKYATDVDVDSLLETLFPKYPFAKSITFKRNSGSDQVSFDNGGVPVAFLHTGTAFGTYHKTTDKPDTLNYRGMEAICNFAYDFINLIVAQDVPPDYIIWSLPEIIIPR